MTLTLSKAQQAAIDSDEPKICILACAGSGKTTTLTRRIARLMNEGKADPKQVVAITFTVLAADKLRTELGHLITRKQAISEMYIGTIHSFCFHLLKLVDPLSGDDYEILDQSRQFVLLNKVWKEWNIEALRPGLGKGKLLDRLQTTINIVKLEGIDSEVLKARHPLIADILNSYKTTLRENLYFDFADLLRLTVGAFERHQPFRELVQSTYKWLFVDEYQDVDPTQERLIEHLSETANLCVVGDDDQAIYQFRGTDVSNILTLADTLPGKALFRLEMNLRCRSNIVATSKTIISKTSERVAKSIEARTVGGLVEAHRFATVQDEINFIVNKIRDLRAQLTSYSDIAILMRSLKSYGRLYLDALRDAEIPFVSKGDRSLFREPVIRRLRGSLEVVAKESLCVHHLVELASVIKADVTTFDGDERDVMTLDDDDWKLLGIDDGDLASIHTILDVRESYFQGAFDSTLEVVLKLIDALHLLRNATPSVLYNVCKFTQISKEFDEIDQSGKVHRLCSYFTVYASGTFDEATPLDSEIDAVQVLTIHQAKGLEFRVVFMPMLVERRFPLNLKDERWLLDNDLFDAARYSSKLDDERRLFYVGATRPQDYLFLTSAIEIGLKNPVKSSMFYDEAAATINQLTDPPAVTDRSTDKPNADMPIVTSYSSLEYYLTCPYRYLLLKEYGLATPSNFSFSLGRTVHLVARLIHEEAVKGNKLSETQIENLFHEHLRLKGKPPPPYVLKRRIPVLVRSLKNYSKNKVDWIANTVEVERPFDYMIPGALIRGRMDLVVQANDDSVEIVDWKTGNAHDYLRSDLQMQIYTLAAQEQLGLDVLKATLYYLEHESSDEFFATEEFLSEGRENLKQIVRGIRDKQFEATPGSVCTRCECKTVCEYRHRGQADE